MNATVKRNMKPGIKNHQMLVDGKVKKNKKILMRNGGYRKFSLKKITWQRRFYIMY